MANEPQDLQDHECLRYTLAADAGRLQVVLEDCEVEPMGVFAVYAHRHYLSAKVRTFVDCLGDYFGSPPYQECGVPSR